MNPPSNSHPDGAAAAAGQIESRFQHALLTPMVGLVD